MYLLILFHCNLGYVFLSSDWIETIIIIIIIIRNGKIKANLPTNNGDALETSPKTWIRVLCDYSHSFSLFKSQEI